MPIESKPSRSCHLELDSARSTPAALMELLGDLRDANAKLVVATLRSKELAEEAAQAEALFNALPDMIARYDRDFRHVYVNAAMERVTGRSRSDLLGKSTA